MLEAEQATLDKHDDDVATLTVHLETLSTSAGHARAAVIPDPRKPLSRRLACIRAGLKRMRDIVTSTDAPIEPSVLMQCQEETTDFKKDLAALYDELISKDVAEDDELSVAHSALEVELSNIASKVKGLLAAAPSETSPPHSTSDESNSPSWMYQPLMETSFTGNNFGINSPCRCMTGRIFRILRSLFIFNTPSKMDRQKMKLGVSHIPEKTTMKQSKV